MQTSANMISPGKPAGFMMNNNIPESSNEASKTLTTLQRVLKQVFCRTKSVSESASLAEFLFKDKQNDTDNNAAETENVAESE